MLPFVVVSTTVEWCPYAEHSNVHFCIGVLESVFCHPNSLYFVRGCWLRAGWARLASRAPGSLFGPGYSSLASHFLLNLLACKNCFESACLLAFTDQLIHAICNGDLHLWHLLPLDVYHLVPDHPGCFNWNRWNCKTSGSCSLISHLTSGE